MTNKQWEMSPSNFPPGLSFTGSYARDDFQAQMALQYRPQGAGENDWVALEYVEWEWTGTFNKGQGSFFSDPSRNGNDGRRTQLDPKWTTVIKVDEVKQKFNS